MRLNVDLGDYIEPREEKKRKVKSKFDEVLDAIDQKNNVSVRDRYEIVNGRDIISTNFGRLTYVDDGKEEVEEVAVQDTTATDSVAAPVKIVKVYIPAKVAEDTASVDTSVVEPQIRSPFASVRLANNQEVQYIPAYVYGDQKIGQKARIKLRLGESIRVDQHKVEKGTVFYGRASITDNAIYVSVNRIGRYNVAYEVYDDDYSHGILLDDPKNGDLDQALTQSAYRSSARGITDLPLDIARDVTQAIVNSKRRRQGEVRLNDGDPVFLAKK